MGTLTIRNLDDDVERAPRVRAAKPLLFKGDDFLQTDVKPTLTPA